MKPALLIIDMQEAYHVGKAAASMDSAAEYIKEVLSYFRKSDLPVVWVHHEDRENGVVPGAPGFEMIESLKKLAKEYTIHKRYGNGFNRTDCAEILRQNGVDTVIVSGFCAEYCVLSTYRGAEDQDFVPFILRGGIASGDAENLRFVERICDTVPHTLLRFLLHDKEVSR